MVDGDQVIIITCNPTQGSLTHAIAKQLHSSLSKKGAIVTTIDLYEQQFNPIFGQDDILAQNQAMVLRDINKYQALLGNAKRLVLVFPLWWGGFPAVLKGFIDRVFCYDFAYTMDNSATNTRGLLTNLTIDIIFTMDNTKKHYQAHGVINSIKQIMEIVIADFCGCTIDKFLVIDNVRNLSRVAITKEIARVVADYE